MYQLLLILKYLVRKIAPLIAAIAVCLCTMMVIVVISVMGGFLDMLESSIQRTTGDVIIYRPGLSGFPHYDQMIEEIEKLPEAAAATPIIENYALLTIDNNAFPVKLVGIRPESFNAVTPYKQNLVWDETGIADHIARQFEGQDFGDEFQRDIDRIIEQWRALTFKDFAMTNTTPPGWQPRSDVMLPTIVIGIEVNPWHVRDEQGQYSFANSLPALLSRHAETVSLTTTPITPAGQLADMRPQRRSFVAINEYKSGHYDVDSLFVFLPFEVAQSMLDMEAFEATFEYDEDTGEVLGQTVRKSYQHTVHPNACVCDKQVSSFFIFI